MTETGNYLAALEYDRWGRPGRVHAVACHDGVSWLTTACGLPTQPYDPTGSEWAAVPADERCGNCAAALAPQ